MVDGMERTQIVQTVANALTLLETQQAGTPPTDLAMMRKLELVTEKLLSDYQAIIDTMDAHQRRWLATGVTALINATADGAVVEGGAWGKERWLELKNAFLSFQTWLSTPIEEDGPTPASVIFKVYTPPV